jgi:hypothetical protein
MGGDAMRWGLMVLVTSLVVFGIGCATPSSESFTTQPNEYVVSVPGMH